MDQETIKVTALQAIFDLLHLYGLEAFKVDASAPSGSDDESKEEEEDEEEQGEEDDKEEQQNKSAANSAVAILSGLLESEVSICKHSHSFWSLNFLEWVIVNFNPCGKHRAPEMS